MKDMLYPKDFELNSRKNIIFYQFCIYTLSIRCEATYLFALRPFKVQRYKAFLRHSSVNYWNDSVILRLL